MANSLFDITGKKAIITGGAQGLGYAMAEALLESGCAVVIIDISSHLEETVRDFCHRGFEAYAVCGNLAVREEVHSMFDTAMKLLNGRLDIIGQAAGIQRRHPSEDFPIKNWDAVIKMNLEAVFLLCQRAAQVMIAQGSGKIINIASMVSWFGGVTVPAYSAAKGGVSQMTKCKANDWVAKGINVNAIAPSYMATELNTKLLDDQKRSNEIIGRIPIGRWGEPTDMKGTTIFLASHASDYLSGAIIPVDGGYLCR